MIQKHTPLARWALGEGVTREVALRRGFRGEIKLVQVDGRWFVVEQAPSPAHSEPIVRNRTTRAG